MTTAARASGVRSNCVLTRIFQSPRRSRTFNGSLRQASDAWTVFERWA
jgi:hypothetical protein